MVWAVCESVTPTRVLSLSILLRGLWLRVAHHTRTLWQYVLLRVGECGDFCMLFVTYEQLQ